MFITYSFIGGLMFGIEFLWEDSILVLDLGIVRIFVGKIPEEFKND